MIWCLWSEVIEVLYFPFPFLDLQWTSRERKRERDTDRQTDRQRTEKEGWMGAGGWGMDRHRQEDTHIYKHTQHTERKTHRDRERQIEKQSDTHREEDTQTHREEQKDREWQIENQRPSIFYVRPMYTASRSIGVLLRQRRWEDFVGFN